MVNDAYEKRALVQSDSRKKSKMASKRALRKLICLLTISYVTIGCIAYYVITKDSSLGSANSKMSNTIAFNKSNDDYTYDSSSIKRDFGSVNFITGDNRLFIKNESLCIQYPRGSAGLDSAGAQINTAIKGKKEYYMQYDICFDGNGDIFDWQDGGMLSSLAGGMFYNGTEEKVTKDGFNAMLIYNNYGYLYPCVYIANDAEVGASIYPSIGQVTENVWTNIKMYVKLNDVSTSDGVFKVWLDDKLCFNQENIRFDTKKNKISIGNFQAYSNESTNGNGVGHEQFVYMDNIRVY